MPMPKFNRKPRAERLEPQLVTCNPPCPELGESHLEHQIKSLRNQRRGVDDDKQDPFMVRKRFGIFRSSASRLPLSFVLCLVYPVLHSTFTSFSVTQVSNNNISTKFEFLSK